MDYLFGMFPWGEASHALSKARPRFSSWHTRIRFVEEISRPLTHCVLSYYRPWRYVSAEHSGTSSVNNGKDAYIVTLDVQHYSPDDINVKRVGKDIVVEGKHDETPDDYGYVTRNFVRRYVLPKNVDIDSVTSSLSFNGVLTITAPKVLPIEEAEVRPIPIQRTGKPAEPEKHTTVMMNGNTPKE